MSSDQLAGVTPADEAFVAAFHAHQLSNQGFHHRDHLRLAWVQIRRLGLERASDDVTSGIRHFAAHHGSAERYKETLNLTVKLPESADAALGLPFTSPTRYRLGRSGWVSARFPKNSEIPLDMFRDWIDESYRAVAPSSLVRTLPL